VVGGLKARLPMKVQAKKFSRRERIERVERRLKITAGAVCFRIAGHQTSVVTDPKGESPN
jgi:hypothetical protein